MIIGSGSGTNTAKLNSGNSSLYNVFIGGVSTLGPGTNNPGGNYNITLGFGADAFTGTASSPGLITNAVAIGADAYVNLDNEFILGNNNHYVGIGMVGEGFPLGKLEVFQHSGNNNTIGEYVTNTDVAVETVTGDPQPLIGIESRIPQSISFYNVAGWFEADQPEFYYTNQPNPVPGYAIYVPGVATALGGTMPEGEVHIGYQFALDAPNAYLVDIDGNGRYLSSWVPSDTILKKNVAPFKYGLKAIRNLNPVSYNYNGVGGFQTSTTYIGLIAQNLQRNVPNGVAPSLIKKDTLSASDTATILNIYEQAVMYTAINAIKQLDSTVTGNKNTDSVKIEKQQQTIDSLRTVLNSIQTCLTQLCNNGHGAIHHHGGGNGNSGDSNSTNDNTQDVTLSAMSEIMLYQNIPNPFSTGTKINYYLPANVNAQEATIVFYDTYGNKMKSVQLTQTGNGTINVTPDNLTSGIYSYSLVVSGNVIDTKRMILQK